MLCEIIYSTQKYRLKVIYVGDVQYDYGLTGCD